MLPRAMSVLPEPHSATTLALLANCHRLLTPMIARVCAGYGTRTIWESSGDGASSTPCRAGYDERIRFPLVSGGTLQLNVGGYNAFGGPLVIGDGTGAGSPTVQNLQSQEISETAPITINLGGTLNLNNFNETISPSLALNSGSISTGTGTLTLSPNR